MGSRNDSKSECRMAVAGSEGEKQGKPVVKVEETDENADFRSARSWYMALSSEERCVALGFTDAQFLSVFLNLAPWSGTDSSNAAEAASDAAVSQHNSASVRLKDVWATFYPHEIGERGRESIALTVKGDSSKAGQAKSSSNHDGKSCTPESDDSFKASDDVDPSISDVVLIEDRVDSDAFRIREKQKSSSEFDCTKEVTEEASPVPSNCVDKSQSTGPTSRSDECICTPFTLDLFESVCVVFPFTFKYLCNEYLEGCFPFVTLHPSLLQQQSELKLFDRAFQAVSHSSFLCEKVFSENSMDTPTISYLWNRRISTLKRGDSLEEELRVPIPLLLLLRFEVAVFMSYYSTKEAAQIKLESVETKGKDSCIYSIDSLRKKNRVCVNNLKLGKGFFNVYARAESLDKVPKASDLVEMKSFVSKVVDITGELGMAINFKLEYLFLTPITILKRNSYKCDSFTSVFECWNKELQTSLKKLSIPPNEEAIACVNSSLPSAGGASSNLDDCKSIASTRNVSIDSTGGISAPQSASPQGTSTKKSGKKRKKRKKKKGNNNDLSKQGKLNPPESNPSDSLSKPLAMDIKKIDVSVRNEVAEVTKSNVGFSDKGNISEQQSTEVVTNSSFESEKTVSSTCEETASTKSDSTKPEETEVEGINARGDNKDHITVSHVQGVGTTVVVAPSAVEIPSTKKGKGELDISDSFGDSAAHNSSEWETVEVRGRGHRKKSSDRSGQSNCGRFGLGQGPSPNNGLNSVQGSGSKKTKSSRTPASRKRVANRKIVREILSSVLEAVDEEVRRRRLESRNTAFAGKTISLTRHNSQDTGNKKETTLRDVVLGRQGSASIKKNTHASSKLGQRSSLSNNVESGNTRKDKETQRQPVNVVKGKELDIGSPSKRGSKGHTADQNTAPTVPETLSAVSTNSLNTEGFRLTDSRRDVPVEERCMVRSDSSSGETDDIPKGERILSSSNACKESSPAPPLPTLLSPGNANSSSSSVASSLEAPHSTHGHHHSCSTANENDVGYHLLDVCDRISRDTRLFMSRRSLALTARRRERGALLAALQETVTKLWPSQCRVEMYGSCATKLDLPSSDLDVVVCGMDQAVTSSPQKHASFTGGNMNNMHSPDKGNSTPESQVALHQQIPMSYVYMHMNAERVLRLAAELELQPWAVHVKAIPTASVPVVKVLADPSRLSGSRRPSGDGNDWYAQKHQLVSQQAATTAEQLNGRQSALPRTFHPTLSLPAWRGSDVPNGLLSLDITFEGPEHGGIGSTEFSSLVVQEACGESNQTPENTPVVQVVMILKELLAQRRLNEPFSGGLSSYALLLLVLAVVRERTIIREELERVERQRRVVAAGGCNSAYGGSNFDSKNSSSKVECVPTPSTNMKPSTPPHAADGNFKVEIKSLLSSKLESTGFERSGASSLPSSSKTKLKTPLLSPASGGNMKSKIPSQLLSSGGKSIQQGKSPKEEIAGKKIVGVKSVDGLDNKQPQPSNKWNSGKLVTSAQKAAEKTLKGRTSANNVNRRQQHSRKGPSSSWASIARMNTYSNGPKNPVSSLQAPMSGKKTDEKQHKVALIPKKGCTFADAVARKPSVSTGIAVADSSNINGNISTPRRSAPAATKNEGTGAKESGVAVLPPTTASSEAVTDVNSSRDPIVDTSEARVTVAKSTDAKIPVVTRSTEAKSNSSMKSSETKKISDRAVSGKGDFSGEQMAKPTNSFPSVSDSNQQLFPQGFNDVIEVLCSGETTAGKLLMHFLLFYGQHFDAQQTAIDISGKHQREGIILDGRQVAGQPYTHLSPYIQRRTAGLIDPVTGMLTVDPIVVYDPLEGAENNNVARRCFLWSNVRWVFAQSYMTLSSAVERNATSPTNFVKNVGGINSFTGSSSSRVGKGKTTEGDASFSNNVSTAKTATSYNTWNGPYNQDDRVSNLIDPSAPLLELLVSF